MSARYLKKEDQITKKCEVCGEEFVCNNTTAIRTRKYCSEKCKYIALRKRQETGEVVPKKNNKDKLTVSEISARAKSLGLTYSQYVVKYM